MFENGLTSGISLKRLIMPAERRFFNRLVGIMNYYDILFYIVLIISILLMFDALKKNREKIIYYFTYYQYIFCNINKI